MLACFDSTVQLEARPAVWIRCSGEASGRRELGPWEEEEPAEGFGGNTELRSKRRDQQEKRVALGMRVCMGGGSAEDRGAADKPGKAPPAP